ncbi:hypothetical protein [Saccharibacillus endophyticus]|uniref:Uncharacterized protein n=1 Tax=Saccharibacillus endophyticus TaxID=2060666 RepID=A0ABQ1ZN10_9BACL|nr:hypothetical protein [Saccharibacillus endophyticus]GGH71643.1 hypothetical protein GCM10007362_08960 [Saccharibacillus endophyticus]
MFKKILLVLLLAVLMVVSIPFTSSAAEKNVYDGEAFDRILNDYVILTGLQETEAQDIYSNTLDNENDKKLLKK